MPPAIVIAPMICRHVRRGIRQIPTPSARERKATPETIFHRGFSDPYMVADSRRTDGSPNSRISTNNSASYKDGFVGSTNQPLIGLVLRRFRSFDGPGDDGGYAPRYGSSAATFTPSALAMRLSVRTVVRSGLRSMREICD